MNNKKKAEAHDAPEQADGPAASASDNEWLAVRADDLEALVRRVVRATVDELRDAENPVAAPHIRPMLKVEDVAAWLQVSKRHVEQLIAEGELVPLRKGTLRRFTHEQVEDYIRSLARGQSGRRRRRAA